MDEIFGNFDSLKSDTHLKQEYYLDENENNLKFIQPSNLQMDKNEVISTRFRS